MSILRSHRAARYAGPQRASLGIDIVTPGTNEVMYQQVSAHLDLVIRDFPKALAYPTVMVEQVLALTRQMTNDIADRSNAMIADISNTWVIDQISFFVNPLMRKRLKFGQKYNPLVQAAKRDGQDLVGGQFLKSDLLDVLLQMKMTIGGLNDLDAMKPVWIEILSPLMAGMKALYIVTKEAAAWVARKTGGLVPSLSIPSWVKWLSFGGLAVTGIWLVQKGR